MTQKNGCKNDPIQHIILSEGIQLIADVCLTLHCPDGQQLNIARANKPLHMHPKIPDETNLAELLYLTQFTFTIQDQQ